MVGRPLVLDWLSGLEDDDDELEDESGGGSDVVVLDWTSGVLESGWGELVESGGLDVTCAGTAGMGGIDCASMSELKDGLEHIGAYR